MGKGQVRLTTISPVALSTVKVEVALHKSGCVTRGIIVNGLNKIKYGFCKKICAYFKNKWGVLKRIIFQAGGGLKDS